MPVRSNAQRGSRFVGHPTVARTFADHTPKGTRLPEPVSDKAKAKRTKTQKTALLPAQAAPPTPGWDPALAMFRPVPGLSPPAPRPQLGPPSPVYAPSTTLPSPDQANVPSQLPMTSKAAKLAPALARFEPVGQTAPA